MSVFIERPGARAAPLTQHASGLSVDVVRSLSALESLQPDYARLHSMAANNSPFALHDWHAAWYANFLNVDSRIHDEIDVRVVRDSDGDCVAIVPLVMSQRRFGPMNVVSLAMVGIDPSTTEHRAPIIARGYERSVLNAVRERLTADHDWDWISWGDLDSTVGTALLDRAHVQFEPGSPGYLLDLAPTWAEFRAGLKRNIRESLRHCYNSLKRAGHRFELQIVQSPEDVEAAITRFLELHDLRARLSGGVKHANHFETAVSRRFLREVCLRLARRGLLRIFQLRIGPNVVASRIGFVINDSLYLYYSGFDPEWAKYSVMTTTVSEAIQYAISQNLKTVNLSRGTDASKTRWGPRCIEYRSVVEPRARLGSRFAYDCYASMRSGKGLHGRLLNRLVGARRVWA